MKLTNHSLQQDVYQYINELPKGIDVVGQNISTGKWFDFYKKRNNENCTWYLAISINDEDETVMYYPYHSKQEAEQDYNQLTNFLSYIYK